MFLKHLVYFQESEGFNEKLLLKQKMNLLSQMSTTPIDCFFKVNNFHWITLHAYTSMYICYMDMLLS